MGDTTASVKKGDADADADYESVTSYPTTAYYGYTYPGLLQLLHLQSMTFILLVLSHLTVACLQVMI